jgi:hypothetical protein
MSGTVGLTIFISLFVVAIAAVVISGRREYNRWRARPGILRALASRRGYRFVENPGKPSELVPIRPLETAANLVKMELPAAVNGRTLDGDFTLFDVFTEERSGGAGRVTYIRNYETFITIRSGAKWPHFEFAAISHFKQGSLSGMLIEMAGNLAEVLMKRRGLVHVPIPDHPGYQLYVDSTANGEAIRAALVPLFENRGPWWVGGLDDALTLQRRGEKSVTSGSLVAEPELDRFIDDALEIERAARNAIPQ